MSNYDDATYVADLDVEMEKDYTYYVALNGTLWRMVTDCWPDCLETEKISELIIDKLEGYYYFVGKDGKIYCSDNKKYSPFDYEAAFKIYEKTGLNPITQSEIFEQENQKERERIDALKNSIINLLKEKAVKMPASDIDAFLRHQDVDEIKELCEDMYHNGEISRTANYRYFILTDEKKKPKKTSAPKTEEVDVEKELEKLKGLLDKGLITQEQYDAKSNELLGL